MPGVTTVDLTPLWQREVALEGAYAYAAGRLRHRHRASSATLDLGRLVSATYPLRRYEDAIAHAADGRLAWRRQDRLRPPVGTRERHHLMPRPGFVLDVDRSTPPILFHHGESLRLEKLPAGRSRVLYPAEPLEPLDDPDAAIRHALDNPLGDCRAPPRPAARRA